MDSLIWTALAADLVRSLRGKRSQSDFSRRIGYRSNIAHRWESGLCWPTAAAFLRACVRIKPASAQCFTHFFKRQPEWFNARDPVSPSSVAAFLRDLRGKTPIGVLAKRIGHSRFSVGRWLRGTAQPKLPELLLFIEASSRRALDFVAGIADPAHMPSVAGEWSKLQRAIEAAYQAPWSHAVLRALELDGYARASRQGERWLAAQLGIDVAEVRAGLQVLATTGQIRKVRGAWRCGEPIALDTGQDSALALRLKVDWTRVALERLARDAPGHFGYSLFAVSRKDLRRLREVHLEYVREMQSLIAHSEPSECVGLYCAQLLHLSTTDNAFAR